MQLPLSTQQNASLHAIGQLAMVLLPRQVRWAPWLLLRSHRFSTLEHQAIALELTVLRGSTT